MTKKKFTPLVNELLTKANSVEFDNYYAAISIIKEFRKFFNKYYDNINKNVLDHIGKIEADFGNARSSKNISEKTKHWNSAMDGLLYDIESMKDENKFIKD